MIGSLLFYMEPIIILYEKIKKKACGKLEPPWLTKACFYISLAMQSNKYYYKKA